MSLSLLPSWVNLAYHKTDENVVALKALYDVNGSLPVLAGTVLLSVTLAFAFRRRKGVEGVIPGASQNDNPVKKLKERPYGGNLYVCSISADPKGRRMDTCSLHISNDHSMLDGISRN